MKISLCSLASAVSTEVESAQSLEVMIDENTLHCIEFSYYEKRALACFIALSFFWLAA